MGNADTGDKSRQTTELSLALSELRDVVLQQWKSRVEAEIPSASKLGDPVLLDMVPRLYDNIVETLATDSSRFSATTGTNFALSHCRERASITDYSPPDLLHELQIFREVLFFTARSANLNLSKCEAEVIGYSIDQAARESISGFNDADHQKIINFIAGLSHDLRNPLAVANATAQLIQLKTCDPSINDLAKRVCRKISEADAMIQSLLDAAVLTSQMKLKLDITSFDIMKLVEDVCADIPLLGKSVRVVGEKVIGYWCYASMKRVLENLISNAQKYGNPSGIITVKVQREEGLMLLSVHNEGKPIPKGEMDRLFKRYNRIDDTHVRGWGLGLPFVQNVAESHGGTVVVDSVENRGTTFTVSIPIDARHYVKN